MGASRFCILALMRMTGLRLAVSLLLTLFLAACGAGGDNSASVEAVSPTPSSPAPSGYQPPPDEDPNNPLLIVYCSMQDRIVTLEGQLLSKDLPLKSQLARMRRAQDYAQVAADSFADAGREHLARLTQRWADSFVIVRQRLEGGQREIDALAPAIEALGAIEPVFTCELDG